MIEKFCNLRGKVCGRDHFYAHLRVWFAFCQCIIHSNKVSSCILVKRDLQTVNLSGAEMEIDF